MATVVFTAIGTVFGGPLGGAIGGLIGRQIDGAVFGKEGREGPKLKELAVTTSSYGQPIPRIFGRMRVGGTIIWSTDLKESSSTHGGKGKPKTTTYNYSVSFAVALSSSPIVRVGRIWADGNLLRGASGDLKVPGTMRLYRGLGDEPVDPLIAAAKSASAPAFRDCAYAVFEDLQLEDYGNRIPALTFEVFASEAPEVSVSSLLSGKGVELARHTIEHARGLTDDGGPLAGLLSAIDRVYPLTCTSNSDGLRIDTRVRRDPAIPELSPMVAHRGSENERDPHARRSGDQPGAPTALRYYDEDRDYQPGVQRASGARGKGREVMIDLPMVMKADGAKSLATSNAHRARWRGEKVRWRVARLDPAVRAGAVVRLPQRPGDWLVRSWEWSDSGVELDLERLAPGFGLVGGTDAGEAITPADVDNPPTALFAFEAPATDLGATDSPLLYAAVSAANSHWRGAALYLERGTELVPIGFAGSPRAGIGYLTEDLVSSPALLFEPEASVEIDFLTEDRMLESVGVSGLAEGANRLLVGAEVLQYAHAIRTGASRWRLQGLLRGRAGTEAAAMSGHDAGETAVLLDDPLTPLDPALVPAQPGVRIAAIGRGDAEPVYSELINGGLSRRPPAPVHPTFARMPDGAISLGWTRRARGQWRWDSLIEVPLIEQQELYRIGYGPADAPFAEWTAVEPRITIAAAHMIALESAFGTAGFWVSQIGTFAQSLPTAFPHHP